MFFKKLKDRIIETFNSLLLYVIVVTNFLLSANYFIFTKHTPIKYNFIISSFIVNFCIIFIIFFVIKNKYIRSIIGFVFITVNFIEFITYITTKSVLSMRVIQAMFETNSDESNEFFVDFFNFTTLSYIALIIVALYFFIKFIVKKINENRKKIKFFHNKVSKLLILFLIFSITHTCRQYYNFGMDNIYEKIPVARWFRSFDVSMKKIERYDNLYETAKKLDIDIKVTKKNNIENIVLIVGESTGKNHMGLYGYKLDNNPALGLQEKRGSLFKFNDVISPHTQTIPSLEKILTLKNYEIIEPWDLMPNIITVMKKAGYNTYWFSNQTKMGILPNIGYAFSTLADISVFNSDIYYEQNKNSKPYDIDLIEIAKENLIISENKKEIVKNFIVFHLSGSHYSYSDRYPLDFKEYDIDYLDNKYNETQKFYISKYDTSVLYNDYVVSEIHNMFKDTNSIIIYLSDHGEELYEKRNVRGHTEGNPSRYMLEIPFTIFVTEKFKTNNSEILSNIRKSVNNKYMTDDLPHTILDIANIKTKKFDNTRSIINPNFNNDRKRLYQGKEYDDYWKLGL